MHEEKRDLSTIELPLRLCLHQQRAVYAAAGEDEIWRGRVDLLDLDVEGFPRLEDTLNLIRSVLMTRGRELTSVPLVNLRQGSVGPVGNGNVVAESRVLTITAEPTVAFRALVYESNLARLQRLVIEAAKAWRVDAALDKQRADLQLESAIDDLSNWECLFVGCEEGLP